MKRLVPGVGLIVAVALAIGGGWAAFGSASHASIENYPTAPGAKPVTATFQLVDTKGSVCQAHFQACSDSNCEPAWRTCTAGNPTQAIADRCRANNLQCVNQCRVQYTACMR
jgi:hypothetical protein